MQSLWRLIDQSESGTFEEKRFQKDGVTEVAKYCNNKVDCRRTQVLAHFGQEFNPRDCHKNCDNCCDEGEVYEDDLTVAAGKAVELVQSMVRSGTNVTQRMCTEVFRGANTAEIRSKGHDQHKRYGAGSDLAREQVERLFDHLLLLGAFQTKLVSNGSGYSNTYVEVKSLSLLFQRPALTYVVAWSKCS